MAKKMTKKAAKKKVSVKDLKPATGGKIRGGVSEIKQTR